MMSSLKRYLKSRWRGLTCILVLAVAVLAWTQLGQLPLPASSASTGQVLIAAGDIVSCTSPVAQATAQLVSNLEGTVAAVGDLAYDSGTTTEFKNCYDPTWGRFKARTRPVPGNHEYYTNAAIPYFNYFGAQAGPPGKGYYSYNLGTWHIVALNSEIDVRAGSEQERWLRADLAQNRAECILAYWHRPRFSSGVNGSDVAYTALWQALYDYGATIVLSGHDHDYERFAPQTPFGLADAAYGVRQFVVGTGGESHTAFRERAANSEVFNDKTFGVLRLTLYAKSYEWQFIPVAGQTFSDVGRGDCHSIPPRSTAPSTIYVADSFKRRVIAGWGTAETGGAYTLDGAASNFGVNEYAGTITLASPNTTRSAYLEGSVALNVDASFRVETDKRPHGGSEFAYLVARRVSAGTDYLGRLRLTQDGAVAIQALSEVQSVAGSLGTEVIVPGLSAQPYKFIRLRLRVAGAHPTLIQMRAWPDGTPEPVEWQYSITDWTPALQQAGAVGVRSYLGLGFLATPVQLTIDDLLVTSTPAR